MRTPASIAGHPIHPMLITLPIGLWIFSLVCDSVVFFSHTEATQILWFALAYYTMAGGLVGALLAAIPGLIDFLSIERPPIRKLAATHMAINLTVVALYAVNLWLRTSVPPSADIGFGLSILGVVLIIISGWIGAEMVHVHGIGVSMPGEATPAAKTEVARDERPHSGSRLGST